MLLRYDPLRRRLLCRLHFLRNVLHGLVLLDQGATADDDRGPIAESIIALNGEDQVLVVVDLPHRLRIDVHRGSSVRRLSSGGRVERDAREDQLMQKPEVGSQICEWG